MRNNLRLHNGQLQRRDYRLSPNPEPWPLTFWWGFAGGVAFTLAMLFVVFGVVVKG